MLVNITHSLGLSSLGIYNSLEVGGNRIEPATYPETYVIRMTRTDSETGAVGSTDTRMPLPLSLIQAVKKHMEAEFRQERAYGRGHYVEWKLEIIPYSPGALASGG